MATLNALDRLFKKAMDADLKEMQMRFGKMAEDRVWNKISHNLNLDKMNEEKLDIGNNLRHQISMVKSHIIEVECDRVKLFAEQPESRNCTWGGINFNKFMPSSAKVKSDYLKNLRAHLKALENQFANL